MRRNPVSLMAALALAIAGSVLTAVPASAQPPAATPATKANPDFDGDGRPDIVYGWIGEDQPTVTVRYGSGRVQQITRTDVQGPADTKFGTAVLARDLNGDGYCDLAVTDPWTPAALVLVFGGASGLDTATARTFAAPPGAAAFGSSLALLTSPKPLLVVGAEETAVPGGALAAYPLGIDGLPSGVPFWIDQSSSGVPGTAEAGDGFGSAVAASGATLVVGVPGEDIGTRKDAGNIVVLTYRGNRSFTGVGIGQNSRGVAGSARTGNRFGASVAIGRGLVAVGVPGENRQAGSVKLFTWSGSKLKPLTAIDQNTRGVPGSNTRYDRFGEKVAIAQVCAGRAGVVVGGPGKSFNIGEDGAAWVIPVTRSAGCSARMLREDTVLGGRLSPDGGHLGAVVGAVHPATGNTDIVLVGGPAQEDGPRGRLYAVTAPYTTGHVLWQDQQVAAYYGFSLSALG